MIGTFYISPKQTTIAYGNFETDFFALTRGLSKTKGDSASQFALETSIWGYTHIRQRRYYWVDKKKLMQRILRSTNIALWQKQRESGCEGEMTVESVHAIIGATKIWIGCTGQTSAYEKRVNGEWRVMGVINKETKKIHPLGMHRYALQAGIGIFPFDVGDVIFLTIGKAAVIPVAMMHDIVDLLVSHPSEGGRFFAAACGGDTDWGVCLIANIKG